VFFALALDVLGEALQGLGVGVFVLLEQAGELLGLLLIAIGGGLFLMHIRG
jgi:hypothetical protein